MHQENWWRLVFLPILLMSLSGCGSSSSSSRTSLSDNGHFMGLWNIYTHCYQSEDLDAMRADAQRLSRAANTINSAADPISPQSSEPVPVKPAVRLSADPAAMAAACALHTGQVAQDTGRPNLAREMFRTVITNFPQPPYRYYVAQARLGLDRLDAASPATFGGSTMPADPT